MIIDEPIGKKKSYSLISLKEVLKIYFIIIAVLIGMIIAAVIVFSFIKVDDDKIQTGVCIKGINVSGLSKAEAKELVSAYLAENTDDKVILSYKNYDFYVPVEQIEASFDIDTAVDYAYSIGKEDNLLKKLYSDFKVAKRDINIDLSLLYNDDALTKYLQDMEKKLPDQLIEPSYYRDGRDIVITSGKNGAGINIDEMKNFILDSLQDLSYNNARLELSTYVKYCQPININQIHSEIYQEPKDAYFTTEPYMVYPHVIGVDFENSIEEINNMLGENKDEYIIPLKLTTPNVTLNDINMEAFPDLLSEYSTVYAASNYNRSTNLELAAEKINGTVLMPGDVFSYNQVVGKRTEEAGFKNAAIYQDGGVVDGLGGGICQISSTLYNAAVMADLEIVYRTNHMFAPSYVPAGADATVAYGSIDFKFKNSRNYPIKIMADVGGGIASVEIYGLKGENEYDITLETKVVRDSTYKVVDAYKVYRKDGEVVDREFLHTDTYNKH